MPRIAYWNICRRIVACVVASLIAMSNADVQAAPVTVPLNAEADLTSVFNTYWSEGVAQLNRPWPNTTRQPFWSTTDPDKAYNNSFDFFPNERAMRFGQLTYDDAGLTSGSGTAAIIGLVLGIEKDPLDPSYVNGTWLSFTTDVTTYSGSVTVVNGAAIGINLTANYTLLGYFGGTPISASGTFTVTNDHFEVAASGYNPALGAEFNPSVAWDWTGKILDADFNGDGSVDAADYPVWRNTLGFTAVAPFTLGDANGDGNVTADDYQVWKSQFGGPPAGIAAATATVPEPASMASVAIAATALCLSCGTTTRGRRRV